MYKISGRKGDKTKDKYALINIEKERIDPIEGSTARKLSCRSFQEQRQLSEREI